MSSNDEPREQPRLKTRYVFEKKILCEIFMFLFFKKYQIVKFGYSKIGRFLYWRRSDQWGAKFIRTEKGNYFGLHCRVARKFVVGWWRRASFRDFWKKKNLMTPFFRRVQSLHNKIECLQIFTFLGFKMIWRSPYIKLIYVVKFSTEVWTLLKNGVIKSFFFFKNPES